MRRRSQFSVMLIAISVCVGLSGCGSGGTGGPNGGGAGGGTIRFTSRKAALDAIAAKFQSLPGTDLAADNSALLTFVQGRSEFEASGPTSLGGVWARFKDGRLLIISNNRRPDAPTRAAAFGPTSPASRSLGIPTAGSKVQLLVDDTNFSAATVVSLSSQFAAAGYSGANNSATVDNLRALTNIGVLYIDAHCGTVILRDSTEEYGLMTSTLLADTVDNSLASDLNSGAVGYMMAPGELDIGGQTGEVKYKITNTYFITRKFVQDHMTFADNSIVFINACGSNGPKGVKWAQSFLDKNAGSYLGWTKDIDNKDAQETARYFFDRVLGETGKSTDYNPESPAQRPFPVGDVLDEMKNRGRSNGHPGKLTESFFGPVSLLNLGMEPLSDGLICRFVMTQKPNSDEDRGLAPTISQALMTRPGGSAVDLPRGVQLQGKFGSASATRKVFIGGQDMTALSTFDNDSNTINITNLPVTGAGSHGDVYVTVNGIKSNVVQITDWKGDFIVTVKRNGNETITVTYTVHLRGILNSLRDLPGQTPKLPSLGQVDVTGADGSALYDATGVDDGPTVRETISRSGAPDIPLSQAPDINATRVGFFGVGLDLTTSPPKMTIGTTANVSDGGGILITTFDKITGKTRQLVMPLGVTTAADHIVSLDAGYNIVAGTWSNASGTITYTWNRIPAVDPPDQTASRSAVRRSLRN